MGRSVYGVLPISCVSYLRDTDPVNDAKWGSPLATWEVTGTLKRSEWPVLPIGWRTDNVGTFFYRDCVMRLSQSYPRVHIGCLPVQMHPNDDSHVRGQALLSLNEAVQCVIGIVGCSGTKERPGQSSDSLALMLPMLPQWYSAPAI